ncbi:Cation/multidrug efflux pump [Moritella sp. JT01]|uniref:efflux RND transporter permease subunit n=1 Tax=Moritella sp. JT01 TaxID=756698 RepID=UPI000796D180|nr:efflux RND transporter permease subunit [Moritella sp. JT01]KXO09264.1 Cation/multidrug efflux pump [Moritella sp. JT01]
MILFFTRHPTAANLIMAMFLALGAITISDMKRETFPDFSVTIAQITVPYPGASPEDVEQAICLPMEDALDGINNLKKLTCSASEGVAVTTAKMTHDGNGTTFISDIKTVVDAIDQFPDEVETTIVKELLTYDSVVSLVIYSDMDKQALKLYAEDVKRRLKRLKGIAQVEINGFSDPQLRVELDLIALRQLNVSVQDVANQIAKQNVKMPSGNLNTPSSTILLRFDAQRYTSRELGEIIVFSNEDGSKIQLKDIATITRRFELDESKISVNGKEGTMLDIKKSKADDSLDVLEEVQQFIVSEKLKTPDSIKFSLTKNIASIAKDRLELLLSNGWQGFILVFLVMWLFFPWRYAIWVAMGLPVSFLASMYVLSLVGISLNLMSMVALLVAIGLLMDDAIVLSESIAHELSKTENKLAGIVRGVDRVKNGVFSSFLTTVAIFGSLAFLEGDMGAVLKVIPITLVITLSVSLVEAFLILPHHLYTSIKDVDGSVAESSFKGRFNKKFEYFQFTILPKVIGAVVDRRYMVTAGIIALFIGTISLASSGILRFSAFPEVEGDWVQITVLMPPGTPLHKTDDVVARITHDIKATSANFGEQPDKESLLKYITVQSGANADAGETGEHVATIFVDLLTSEKRSTRMADYLAALQQQIGVIPGVTNLIVREPTIGPAGRAIDIELSHPSIQTLKDAGNELAQYLSQFNGVSNIISNLRDGKPELRMSLLPGAETFGVTGQDIAMQLRAAFFGVTVDELQIGSENVELDVRLAERYRSNLAYYEDFPFTLADGSQIPLASIVKVEWGRGVSQLNRINNIRTMSLKGDIDKEKANTVELMTQMQKDFVPSLTQKYPGIEVRLGGEVESTAETGTSMVKSFSIGLFVVFAILSFQFRSYVEPLIVMLAIPLALIGVFWGHYMLNYDLTMPSMLGFTSLAGIVVNNSILLVQFIKEDLIKSNNIRQAAIHATTHRIRAILITTATTAAGLMPILLEQSIQAQVIIPLVVALIFGLLASTMLVILILPAFYGILDDFGLTERHKLSD